MDSGPSFPHLLAPLRIGPVELRNRIVSSGHDTVMASDGLITDQLVAYHEARARGGAGLIVVQVAGVHGDPRDGGSVLQAFDDRCIPGYARLAAALHAHRCAVFGQLFHGGRETGALDDGSQAAAVAPSSVPNERFLVMPRAMTRQLIAEVVQGYAAAAGRLAAAGLDGVEVVASHGYLPAQFLNPHVNHRTDEYGGSLEARVRFLREVLVAVRAAVGPDVAVGVRVSVDEMAYEGLSQADSLESTRTLAEDGLVDYVSVVAGSSATYVGSSHIVASMNHPAAYTAPLAGLVKAVVSVPVIVAGRINQPHEAEAIIAEGQADACAMTRALICDPELPRKTKLGLVEEIRACIGCNQACIGHYLNGYPISCIQHPETGRELTYGELRPAAVQRRVLVVGGGPGGLKVAAVAAARGHQVDLYDAGRRPGGQVLLAERLPGRAEFGGLVTNLRGEAERGGVVLHANVLVSAELVRALAPDVVVVATGAVPYRPELDLVDDPVVLDGWQVIAGEAVPSGPVVVADWRGDWIGLGVARRLASEGHRVTLAVNAPHAGFRLQQYLRDEMLADVLRLGVTVVPMTRPYGADADTVYLRHTLTGEPVILEGVAALVLAQGHRPVHELLDELTDYPGDVCAVGDCLSPRTAEEAVLEGLQVGSSI